MSSEYTIKADDVIKTSIRELTSYESGKKYTVAYDMKSGSTFYGLSKSFDAAVLEQQHFTIAGWTKMSTTAIEGNE